MRFLKSLLVASVCVAGCGGRGPVISPFQKLHLVVHVGSTQTKYILTAVDRWDNALEAYNLALGSADGSGNVLIDVDVPQGPYTITTQGIDGPPGNVVNVLWSSTKHMQGVADETVDVP